MKNKILFIFIFVTLFELLSSVSSVQAQGQVGNCQLNYSYPFPTVTQRKTNAECTTIQNNGVCYVYSSEAPPTFTHRTPEQCAAGNNPPVTTTNWEILSTTWSPDFPSTCTPPQVLQNGTCVTPTTLPPGPETEGDYILLEPLPCKEGFTGCPKDGQLTRFDPTTTTGNNKLGIYLNLMINLIIGLCAVAAVVIIVISGIQYSASELISGKEDAIERIKGAILGLLLALCSYLILYTINPDLLNTEVDVAGVTLDVDIKDIIVVQPDGTLTNGEGGPINPASIGTSCDSSVILQAAREAGVALNPREAATFSCIITPESGCKSVRNYAWGRGSSAYGVYQILLQGHSARFEHPACWAAAGVRPISCSRGFRNGNPLNNVYTQQCMRAADNFVCSTAVAVSILRDQGFGAWTADAHSAKQRACIARLRF